VIDEMRPYRAAQKSVSMVISKLPYFLLWLAIALVLLSAIDFAALALLPHSTGSLAVLLLNSILLMPFLIVLQTQIYMSKYTILD
jgi:hypothetical protein